MSKVKTQQDQAEHNPEQMPELSAEERQMLARVEKQVQPRGRMPRWQRKLESTLFYHWWWCL